MVRAVADTHTVIWYVKADRRLSPTAKTTIDDAAAAGDIVLVSAITFVEIVFLIDRGRIDASTFDVVLQAFARPNAVLVEAAVDHDIARALYEVPHAEVPELGDRIIAATAAAAGVPVISRDRKIRLSRVPTIW
jgi:PIN domain nuclease of toxin-antitoxin system